jgi:glycosyltransferase involved in cell wall biosynthesis
VFVGSGESAEVERLKMVARQMGVISQIRFAGYQKGSVGLLLRQFDVLAMLTKDFEGFGLTIAEAMLAGTPVLATMVGAVPEFVTPELALLIQPEAPEEIAAALIDLMAHREEAQQRARRAQLHIKKFSGRAMAQRFHRLILTSGVQD